MKEVSMNKEQLHAINEQVAASAFSQQALHFDQTYSGDSIILYKRQRVRDHVIGQLPLQGAILELNAGTGEDAVFFARQGYRVHATDIAAGMLNALQIKVEREGLKDRITTERCSFTALQDLRNHGPFDLVFSNFAGLNCTGELHKTLGSLSGLLKPGGRVILVLLPPFCLWESLLIFRGKFRTAFRRWFSRRGVSAHVDGHYFRCWYYPPSYIIRTLQDSFDLLSVEGLCTIVPPSYIEHFAEKHPKAFRILRDKEDRWKSKWPWKYIGDYYIISLKKKD
jgi:ubiquinone/menaquinone biosynthesis C-methylase UbiE